MTACRVTPVVNSPDAILFSSYDFPPFRHLESELSRLKHKDPLRTCEVRSVDIILDERGL